MMKRWASLGLASAAIGLTVAACGSSTGGEAVTASPSAAPSSPTVTIPAGLNTGSFGTTPYAPKSGDYNTAWVAEGNRMGEYIVSPTTIDSTLTMGGAGLAGFPVINAVSLSQYVPDGTAAVFLTQGMKVGNTATRGTTFADPSRALRIGLYRFDGDATATTVLDRITTRTNDMPKVTVPGTSGVSATEFKPGTVDSYLAVGQIVINISGTAPTTAEATELVAKAYPKQIDELKKFTPTPAADILKAPVDIDGMLARTLDAKSTDPEHYLQVGVIGINGLAIRVANTANMQRYRDAGVDLVSTNGGTLYRTKDANAATKLLGQVSTNTDRGYVAAGPVPQLPTSACVKDPKGTDDYQFRCFITNGRYLADLTGATLETAQQKAAAQWVILAKNP